MIEVEAVKSRKDISEIETLLRINHGEIYADVWRVGLNMSLRISDLLAIRFDGLDLDRREYTLVERKTRKKRTIRLNKKVIEIINRRRKEYPSDIYLFQVHSNRANGKPISRNSVSRAFKESGDRKKLKINTHSMRKTLGFFMHKDGKSINLICKVLNHSHPAVSMRYIGITGQEVMDSFDEYEL